MMKKLLSQVSPCDSPKRLKPEDEDDPFADGMGRDPLDICTHGTDGTGYISVVVFMTWPVKTNRARYNVVALSLAQPGARARFDIEFSGPCAQYFGGPLKLQPNDMFDIALKGVRVVQLKKSSGPDSLNMHLKWEEGVVLKLRRRGGGDEEQVIDVLKLISEAKVKGDELDAGVLSAVPPEAPSSTETFSVRTNVDRPEIQWRSSPEPNPVLVSGCNEAGCSNEAASSSMGLYAIPPHSTCPPASIGPPIDSPPTVPVDICPANDAISPIVSPVNPPKAARLARRKRRRMKRQMQSRAAKQQSNAVDVADRGVAGKDRVNADVDTGVNEKDHDLATIDLNLPKPPSLRSEAACGDIPDKGIISAIEPPAAPTLQPHMLKGNYLAISKCKPGFTCHLICVVTSNPVPRPRKTTTDELTVRFSVVDPSNFNTESDVDNCGLEFRCFTQKWEGWLPAPKFGDVVVLRDVKVRDWNHRVTAMGYKDKLMWSIYDASTHTSHHGPPSDSSIPRQEIMGGAYSCRFSPFWEASVDELQYCKQLKEWWEAWQERRRIEGGDKIVVLIGDDQSTFTKPPRRHRLISEAGPKVEPSGFFDCTVEVLHGHQNNNGVYSLYVTDYTANDEIYSISEDWCDPLLANRVLKMEMWDGAADYAREIMSLGEYYMLGNVKMKYARNGYVVGTLTFPEKIRRLDVEAVEREGHLRELLQRKKEWKANSVASMMSNNFEYLLLKDIKEATTFFNCLVEILHIEAEAHPCLYVTDYTEPPAIALPPDADKLLAKRVKKLAFKVTLRDGQEDMIKYMKIGKICAIQKLRAVVTLDERRLQGRLGGPDRLIRVIDVDEEDDENALALLRRKKDWECGSQASSATSNSRCKPSADRQGFVTIKDIHGHKRCPKKFCCIARVTDFAPFDFRDCVVAKCTGCEQELDPRFKACVDCDAKPLEFSYRFILELQDEKDTSLMVCVNDDDVCSFLYGLRAVDLYEDRDAFDQFMTRLKPTLGNLVEYRESIEKGRPIEHKDAPLMKFVIDSWPVEGDNDRRKYGLIECTPL